MYTVERLAGVRLVHIGSLLSALDGACHRSNTGGGGRGYINKILVTSDGSVETVLNRDETSLDYLNIF